MVSAILIAAVAGSYAWGMRGCALGAEKGAMLPGAMFGILLAYFSGGEVIRENFMTFAAAGAIGMYFGGTETYAQTMGFVLGRENSARLRAKGILGLSLKGALWFGIFAAFIGIAFSASAGLYSVKEILILLFVMIVLRWPVLWLFNNPYRPAQKKFPLIYFSDDRREEWGGLLAVFMVALIFAVVKGDNFVLFMILSGVIGGPIGWIIGIALMYFTMHPMKNGKYIFGSLQKKKFIDNWKIMEFALGAVGFVTVMVCFIIKKDTVVTLIDQNGMWNPIGSHSKQYANALFLLFLVTVLAHIIVSALGKAGKRYDRLTELFERFTYVWIPFALIVMGSRETAAYVGIVLLVWVMIEKMTLEQFSDFSPRLPLCIPLWMIAAGFALAVFVFDVKFSMLWTWIIYLVIYEYIEMIWEFRPKTVKQYRKKTNSIKGVLLSFESKLTVHIFFNIEILILFIYGVLKF